MNFPENDTCFKTNQHYACFRLVRGEVPHTNAWKKPRTDEIANENQIVQTDVSPSVYSKETGICAFSGFASLSIILICIFFFFTQASTHTQPTTKDC